MAPKVCVLANVPVQQPFAAVVPIPSISQTNNPIVTVTQPNVATTSTTVPNINQPLHVPTRRSTRVKKQSVQHRS